MGWGFGMRLELEQLIVAAGVAGRGLEAQVQSMCGSPKAWTARSSGVVVARGDTYPLEVCIGLTSFSKGGQYTFIDTCYVGCKALLHQTG